jgi:hypothetical protein
MNTSEAKLAAIKSAYGDAWEKVKDHLDEHGWCLRNVNGKRTNGMEPEVNGFELSQIHILQPSRDGFYRSIIYPSHLLFKWRPKSIHGLEDNNGWRRIDEQGPNVAGDYYVCANGKFDGTIMNSHEINLIGNPFEVSHWRPIDPVDQPIY